MNARFRSTSCSQCGRETGAGDHGFSHCTDHQRRDALNLIAAAGFNEDGFLGESIRLEFGIDLAIAKVAFDEGLAMRTKSGVAA